MQPLPTHLRERDRDLPACDNFDIQLVAVVDLLHDLELLRVQAGRAVAGLALERFELEVALGGIRDETVLEAVDGVALRHDRVRDEGHLLGGDGRVH